MEPSRVENFEGGVGDGIESCGWSALLEGVIGTIYICLDLYLVCIEGWHFQTWDGASCRKESLGRLLFFKTCNWD